MATFIMEHSTYAFSCAEPTETDRQRVKISFYLRIQEG